MTLRGEASRKRSRGAACALALAGLLGACAHQVIDVGPPAAAPPRLDPAIPLTVAVRPGSFEASRLSPLGITEHFAAELRDASLFEGVIQPVPAGFLPRWEIQLAARDGGVEPDSNFWKSLFGNALPPLLLFLHLENDYTLQLEALLVRDREIVGTYQATSTIRNRYQVWADKRALVARGLDRLARRATRDILAQLAADETRLRALSVR